MEKRTPRPRDANQLAKMMIDIASGETPDTFDDGKDPAAVELGRKGGLAGGNARAAALSDDDRSDIAKKAATARWSKESKK
jgi:hypothetical protein